MIDDIRSCGSCVRAEFADEDSDGLDYVVKPGAKIAHVKRPSGSFGTGGAFQGLAWLSRGRNPYTYCGQPITDDWKGVEL